MRCSLNYALAAKIKKNIRLDDIGANIISTYNIKFVA